MTNPFLAKLAALKASTQPATTPAATPETNTETNAANATTQQVAEQPLTFAERLAQAKAKAKAPESIPAKPKAVGESSSYPRPEVQPNLASAEPKATFLEQPKAETKELTFLEKLALAKQAKLSQIATAAAQTLVDQQTDQAQAEQAEDLVYTEPDGTIVFNTADAKIRLNELQMQAVRLAAEGKSFCLTGAAGTGKTTAQAGVVWSLHQSGSFQTHNFKYIGEQPSIALVAFTKVAVRNMQRALRKNPLIEQYANHCMTIHSLLEYEPVDYTDVNDEGEEVTKWGFKPQRTAYNPLTLTHLIIEEASMVDLTLWGNLFDALPVGVQIIFLGDLNQLKPIFGDSILAYALGDLPVIELTEVYRQALESPIISNAHRILNGQSLETSQDGKFNVVVGKHQVKVGQAQMAQAMLANFKALAAAGRYDPETDMILSPWNKREMGTKAINADIATWLGYERGAEVIQVKAGRNTWWLAVGDRVLVDKRLGHITRIADNPKYLGGATARGLYSRTGVMLSGANLDSAEASEDELDWEDYSNFSLAEVENELEEGQRASSHLVYVTFQDDDTGAETELSSGGDFADDKFTFGYCLTVHKAQGSEWPRVFMLLHWDHAATATRELLYTAVTRAAEEFTIFTKTPVVDQAISRASYKGKTLADKIAYFEAAPSFKGGVPLLSKINH